MVNHLFHDSRRMMLGLAGAVIALSSVALADQGGIGTLPPLSCARPCTGFKICTKYDEITCCCHSGTSMVCSCKTIDDCTKTTGCQG